MNRLKFLNIKNCVEDFRFSVHIVLNMIFTLNTPSGVTMFEVGTAGGWTEVWGYTRILYSANKQAAVTNCVLLINNADNTNLEYNKPVTLDTCQLSCQMWCMPGVQIIWSNSRCRLHTSAALQLQLFVSDLPLNQSEYTADTLSSNQNRVDHRKWNFNVIFTLAHL